jgi:hypothetical protein
MSASDRFVLPTVPTPRKRRWIAPAIAVPAVLIAAVVAWLLLRRSPTPVPPDGPTGWSERQLTTGSSANDVATVSPDGKTLALARDVRLVLEDLVPGTTRDLEAPASPILWLTWFPDGTRLLLGVKGSAIRLDMIELPIDGGRRPR